MTKEPTEKAREKAAERTDREYDRAVRRGPTEPDTGGLQQTGTEGGRVDAEVRSDSEITVEGTEEIAAPFDEDSILERIDRERQQNRQPRQPDMPTRKDSPV